MLRFEKPLVIGVVTPRTMGEDLEVIGECAPDVIEFRADLQEVVRVEAVLKQLTEIRSKTRLPILFTLRDAAEGGEYDGESGEREMIYRSVLPQVDAVDIEAANLDIFDALRREIRHRAVTSILSYHNFEVTPDTTDLEKMIAFSGALVPDIIKIATVCATSHDALRLLSLPEKHPEQPLAVVGMGEFGRVVRIIGPSFGSVLGYASITAVVAPGQLTVEELRAAWKLAGILKKP